MTSNNVQSSRDLDHFVERHYAELIHFVRSKVPEQDAHELVQDSLAVLVAKRDQVQNFRAFTFAVVKNKLRQYYEKQKRGGMLDFLVDMEELMPMSVMSTRLSIRVARSHDLEAAMQKLPRKQYEIFELRYVHDLTLEETAEALETSTATVKRDLDRARKSLVGVLGDAHSDDAIREIVRGYVQLPLAAGQTRAARSSA
jgi:RNA polymerase sigma factor (sigma-70 family)